MRLAVSTFDGLVWRWRGDVSPFRGGEPGQPFDQSTFTGFPWKRSRMAGIVDSLVPEPSSDRIAAARFVIERLGDGQTVEALAEATALAFPALFSTVWSAKEFARRCVRLCGP
jgi:hypothetical protein